MKRLIPLTFVSLLALSAPEVIFGQAPEQAKFDPQSEQLRKSVQARIRAILDSVKVTMFQDIAVGEINNDFFVVDQSVLEDTIKFNSDELGEKDRYNLSLFANLRGLIDQFRGDIRIVREFTEDFARNYQGLVYNAVLPSSDEEKDNFKRLLYEGAGFAPLKSIFDGATLKYDGQYGPGLIENLSSQLQGIYDELKKIEKGMDSPLKGPLLDGHMALYNAFLVEYVALKTLVVSLDKDIQSKTK